MIVINLDADYRTCDTEGEIRQGRNVIDAAIGASVKHLVLSTVLMLGTGRMGVPHVDSKLELEAFARVTRVPLTLIKPASFMDNIGSRFFPVTPGRIRGFVAGDAKVPYVACSDIGALAAAAFARPDELIGRSVSAIGDLVSGREIAETLSRLRGGETFRYSAAPGPIMWLVAREFYKMRRAFERYGRDPIPQGYYDAMDETRRLCPAVTTVEAFLRRESYDRRVLQ